MAILSSTGISGFLSSAKATGKQILNKAGKLIPEYVEDFVSGFAGHGWKIWNYRSEIDSENNELKKYKLEIDSLTVRESMTVFELLIQKIRAVKGALSITQASGKVATAVYDEEASEWLLTVEDEMSFAAHDIIRCQSWDNGTLKGYWVEISEIRKIEGVDTIVIPAGEFSGGIGYDKSNNNAECVDKALTDMITPAAGDEIIQFGNSKVANRQSAVYIHADEGGQPAIDILFGITTKSFAGCVKTRIGGDIPGGNGVKGFYCENGMIKGVSNDNITYCIYPNGSAEFGSGSARFDVDRSGHIAGGAISWEWNNEKKKYICTMNDVVLTWDNLSDDTKENLKGEDAVIYELIVSTELFVKHESGHFTPGFVSCDVRKTTGTTSKLMSESDIVADGLSFGWVRDDSGFISMAPGDYVTPDNDCFPIVFYLEKDNVTICSKTVVTVENGMQGYNGENGEDAIYYLIEFEEDGQKVHSISALADGTPKGNALSATLYRVIGDVKQLCNAGKFTIKRGSQVQQVFPLSGSNEFHTISIDYGESTVRSYTITAYDKTNTLIIQSSIQKVLDGRQGEQGIPGSDADVPEWLKKWNGYATEIGSEYIVTPAMFTGKKNPTTNALTGIVQGKECIEIDGKKHSGIFALEDDKLVFSLDPVTKKYLFRGRVEATEGSFSGKVTALSGDIGCFKVMNGNLTGYDKDNVKRIEFTQNKIPKLDELIYDEPEYLKEKVFGGASVIEYDSGNVDNSGMDLDYNDDYIDSDLDYYNRLFWMYDIYDSNHSNPGRVVFKVPFKLIDSGYVTFDIESTISNPYVVNKSSVEIYNSSNRTRVFSYNRTLLDTGDYYLKIILAYDSGELYYAENKAIQVEIKIKSARIEKVIGCNIIGTDGIISRWGANKYLFFNNDTGFEVRFGNFGLKLDSSGIKKCVNGSIWSNL